MIQRVYFLAEDYEEIYLASASDYEMQAISFIDVSDCIYSHINSHHD